MLRMNTDRNGGEVFTYYKNEVIRFDLHHVVYIKSDVGIPYVFIKWCTDNCNYAWGWFFKGDGYNIHAFIGFANKEEYTLFCLSNNYT